ncbi:hypothetical protein CRYUN_Cryun34aG0082200 [Craigia yunnanensis]
MSEALEELWNKFTFTEEEQSEVVVKDEWIDDLSIVGKNCVLEKFLMRKMVNVEAMKMVFLKLWKIFSGMTIREVGEMLFVFQFADCLEKIE